MASTPRKPDVVETIERLSSPGLKLPAAPTSYVKRKVCSGNLVCTESYVDVPGCSFTTPFAASWDIRSFADIEYNVTFVLWQVLVNGVFSHEGHLQSGAAGRLSLGNESTTAFIAAGSIIKMQGRRVGGAGNLLSGHTSLVCQRCI